MAYRGLGDPRKADAHLRERGSARTTFLPDPLMQELEELPSSAQAYEFKGSEAVNKGEWTAAAQYFRKGVELAPDNPSVRLKLADALRRSGLAEESLPHYEHVIKIDPHRAEARFGYAMALVRLRRYQQARNHLTEGMTAFPNEPAFAQALARLLAAAPDDRVRDGRRALAMIHELLKQQQSTDLGETMAMALAASGQYDEAVALQRALLATAQRAGREDLARVMTANLKLYEARQPCRTPWANDSMP
jgi:tetratricopeptide (TPR) repeat protein